MGHRVELLVKLPTYQTPGLPTDKRRRMAIAYFRPAQSAYRLPQGRLSAELTSERLREGITRAVTQSRRLAVVDRAHDFELSQEKAVLYSAETPIAEKARLGKVLGADYLLVGHILELDGATQAREIRVSGERFDETKVKARVHYEVIAVATQQVKWADDVAVAVDVRGEEAEDVFSLVGDKLARTMLNNIYPLRVVETAGQEIVINQGGDTLTQGERFEVFNLSGKTIIDPYTKEPLGKAEQRVGLAEIMRVTPKLTYARLIEGDVAKVQKHAVLRPHAVVSLEDAVASERRGTQVEVQEGGGVRLPMDRRR